MNYNRCGCNYKHYPIAMTYVPMQPWERLFELEIGFKEGTVFPTLRLPFERGGCK